MYIKKIFAFLFTIIIATVISEKLKCSKDPDSFKCRLTSITPYRFITDNISDSEVIIPGCEAKKIWLLIRHGTRYPGKKILSMMHQLPDIQKTILSNCQKHNCPLNEEERMHLANWTLKLSMNDEMMLTTEGEDELIAIGERFQSRFPGLMPIKYSNDTYKFKFTANKRTEESAKHFAIGLFGKHQSRDVWYPKSQPNDPILRFYKTCEKWQRDIGNNANAYVEVEKFKNSSVMIKMLEDWSNRFNYKINFDTAELIRKVCAFETAWSEENMSPWCNLFTTDDFKILEYIHDLKYYWIDGYGYQLTYEHACSALVDMFNFMETNDGVKTSAYFTHSGTLLKVLSLLGVANDKKPLLHNNYHTLENRLWRTSLIDTFATNIAFVLYNCKSTGLSIVAMHQERIIQLPGCPKGIPCSIYTMKNNYPDTKKECNFFEMCSIDT